MPKSFMTMAISTPQMDSKNNLEIGKEYVIGTTSDYSGRRAILLELVPYHPDKPDDLVAKVRFSDDHRFGRVEINDLREIGQVPEKPKELKEPEKMKPLPQQPQTGWNYRANSTRPRRYTP